MTETYGSTTLDGNLSDWSQGDRIDLPGQGLTGFEVYGRFDGTHLQFALKKSAGSPIGANTTIWLDWDFNHSSGHHVFGSGLSGHEYKIEFDSTGVPWLYSLGASGSATEIGTVPVAYNADHTIVEVALPVSMGAQPPAAKIAVQVDINDNSFLPTDYATGEFMIANSALLPERTSADHRIAIVYSETTAGKFWGLSADINKTGYSQLFMAAQSQAMQAGVPFDVISESDLKDLSKIINYDALVFPSFRFVNVADVSAIEQNLLLASRNYHVAIIAAGDFMTNDQNGDPLSGNPYSRMNALLDLKLDGSGSGNINLVANTSNPVLSGYDSGELVHSYNNVGYNHYSGVVGTSQILASQVVGGQTLNAVVMTETGGTNIHFATESYLGDNNLLGQAIHYAVYGEGPSVSLTMTRDVMLVASRNDMDEAQESDEVTPTDDNGQPIPGAGIYDQLLLILQQWKEDYNFVGSYYVTVGANEAEGRFTDWARSGPLYQALIDLGNEIGSHSYTHLSEIPGPPTGHGEDTNFLDLDPSHTGPGTIDYEFNQSKLILAAHGFPVVGAAVPGMPELLKVSQAIQRYYQYVTGGWTGIGSGYPNAFGYLTPDNQDSVYIAPNITFDFTQIAWQGKTPAQADEAWAAEFASLTSHASTPIIVWPWHDYGATNFQNNGYSLSMYTNMIARAAAAGAEFVTLADLAERINSFHAASIQTTVSGNTVTANVTPGTGHDLGTFGLEVRFAAANQVIQSVSNWYAYDAEKVLLPVDGGSFVINIGTAQDDVTRIVKLPMRADLVSLAGNGTDLTFTLSGAGTATVIAKTPHTNIITVEGVDSAALAGSTLALTLNTVGLHENISITQSPTAVANVGHQFFFGGLANDVLTGGGGNDLIDGGDGNDTAVFSGFRANYNITQNPDSTYTIADTRSGSPDGTDTIRNIELFKFADWTFTATQILTPYTIINGTSANNTLRDDGISTAMIANGLAGNDTYVVTKSASIVNEGSNQGGDLVQTTLNSYLLPANVENLTFIGSGAFIGTGNTLANVISGGFAADTLDGGGGADRLLGGNGNDTYVVNNAGVTITEAAGAGIDTVHTTLTTFTLGANVENLRYMGTASFSGTGNSLANLLAGGSGNDFLTGGAGDDKFEFRKGAAGFGHDTITSFDDGAGAAGDSIQLASDVFTNFAQVLAASSQSGANVVITLDANNTITIQNFALGNITSDDFTFVV